MSVYLFPIINHNASILSAISGEVKDKKRIIVKLLRIKKKHYNY